ncbi:hypothetical protein [Psychromonas aquimarina]|uniref:hypothetical protein n=1 Tax=Psychromonas aquimarina TaxID=444919 RepID=UPI000416BA2A|nr:hypothetical protein [Psychromonas aquimarina]
MARKHKYVITINFDYDKSKLVCKESVPYPFSKSYKDLFEIFENKIEITAHRSNRLDISGVFENYNSAIYTQIVKSLVYFYSQVGKALEIINISIDYIYDDELKSNSDIKNGEINQIVKNNDDLSILKKVNGKALEVIFEETSRGHAHLIAMTHLVKSFCSESIYDAFERKWKAFNAIYREAAGSSNASEFSRLCFMRENVISFPANYPLILNEVAKLDAKVVREKLRWVKFIHNNFSNLKRPELYKDFILANDDYRLAEINKSTLSVRELLLKNEGFYDEVVKHLNDKIDNKVVNNPHLAATLCIKYMYFVRNKSVHAEKVDSSFRLTSLTKEESEISWLSSLLDLMLIDLVNGHSNFN